MLHVGIAPPAHAARIAVEARAECPFSMAQEYAAEYFRAAELAGPEAEIGVRWRFPFPMLRHRVALSFGVHSDVMEQGRAHDEIHVQWTSGMPILPDFHGVLRFRIEGTGTRVLVDGWYLPPLGPIGRAFDRHVGRWIASESMRDLADRVAAHLTQREGAWRAQQPASTRAAV